MKVKTYILSKDFLYCYPIKWNVEKYLSSYKTITFREDDLDFKNKLLEIKPNYLIINIYDRTGVVIRIFEIFDIKYSNFKDPYKIKIKFKIFEDRYF